MPSVPTFDADDLRTPHGTRPTGVRAISFDLDDTLWPIAPCLVRAEAALLEWLRMQAPGTRERLEVPGAIRAYRDQADADHPELHGNMTALRLAAIRALLRDAQEPEALAAPAFDVFFTERCRVELYDDALPALELLSRRMPLVALSNGNACVHRAGVGRYFKGALNPASMGTSKPDAAAFHAAAALAGVAPGELLHVGDDWMYDVEGALGAGVQAAWLRRDGSDVQAHPQARERSCVVADLHRLCALLA